MNKRRAVAVIYATRHLYDFIWYYATYGKEYEWIVICGDYEGKNLSDVCRKIGIFKDVLLEKETFINKSLFEKMGMFINMLLHNLFGMRTRLCEKLIRNVIGEYDYELAVVPTDLGILCGAFIAQGKHKKVVILEDGMGDYVERMPGTIFKHLNNVNEIIGYVLAKLGYANPQIHYVLKTTQYCEKYSYKPENMKYLLYKRIMKLGDMEKTELEVYNNVLEKAFNVKQHELNADVVLFTAPYNEYVDNEEEVERLVVNYINENYKGKSVIVKMHPRDRKQYMFDASIKKHVIGGELPAEVFIKAMEVEQLLFMYPSATILYSGEDLKNLKVFHFDYVEIENPKSNSRFNYKENFRKALCEVNLSKDSLINL